VRDTTVAPITRGFCARWTPRREEAAPAEFSVVDRVLWARRIVPGTPEAASFLEPSLMHLHDPSLLPGLEAAAARILRAARSGERIVVYGDYDVDGVSASAVLWHTLRALSPGADVGTYIPHRVDEGYGLNPGAIRELCAAGAAVIVSVDCGVTAVESASAARAAGCDLIITDHHNLPEGPLPDAFAIVHPRLPGSAYPFGDLCGAGVAFKLAWRLMTMAHGSSRLSPELRDLLLELLGLTSLGVIADIVPLLGENRTIARFGLARIKHSRVEGLRALVHASGLAGEKVREEDVGFRLGPRLNACGRMGHAREALELLTTATGARAIELADQLSRQNDERRAAERRMADQAADMAEAEGMTGPARRAIVLAHDDWHTGVVGIVCSRLVERFHRPVILMRCAGGECHGSGRSIEGFSLHGALARCSHLLLGFGGHDAAAGLRLETTRLAEFREAFTAVANESIGPEELTKLNRWDADATLEDLTVEGVRGLSMLAPFGAGNPCVALRVPGVRLAARPELFGANANHLGMHVRSPGGRVMRVVAWNWANRLERVARSGALDLWIEPQLSTWNGSTRVEPRLLDAAEVAG